MVVVGLREAEQELEYAAVFAEFALLPCSRIGDCSNVS
jgi:hypothetical protein